MTISLASPLGQFVEETNPTTVSYEGRQVYNVESESLHNRPIYRNFDTPLSETERYVCRLLARQEGWDGYNAPRPNPASITYAYSWIIDLYRDVSAELWIKPHVSSDEEGDVTFEWWKGRKKLTVYISPEMVEYVKVERRDTGTEMEDGVIGTPTKRRELWNWLRS